MDVSVINFWSWLPKRCVATEYELAATLLRYQRMDKSPVTPSTTTGGSSRPAPRTFLEFFSYQVPCLAGLLPGVQRLHALPP